LRRNAYVSNRRRRRTHRRHAANPRRRRRLHANRRHHTNRRRSRRYSRNANLLMNVLKIGGLVTVGLVGQKVLSGVIRTQILDRFMPAAAPVAPAAGLGALAEYNPLIAGAIAAIGGAFVTNMVVKNADTKAYILGGLGAGFLHSLLVFALGKVGQPNLATMLAGDATAARIAAMYGLGAGASLQPRYAPIGEYFGEPGMSGLGSPLMQAAAGMGAYGANPDIFQAAAGYGDTDTSYGYGNHISPSSDLDRELTIAEAAAGIGVVQQFEANAGTGEYLGEYFGEPGMSGLGATVRTLPAADTWVPGMSNASLWAGVKPATGPQAAHMMLPAGVLETSGGSGIFG
jgi:hypothetical protein